MAEYKGTIELVSGITQKNGNDFKLVNSKDVQYDDTGQSVYDKLYQVDQEVLSGYNAVLGKAKLNPLTYAQWNNPDNLTDGDAPRSAAYIAEYDLVVGDSDILSNKTYKNNTDLENLPFVNEINAISKASAKNKNLKAFYTIHIASRRVDGGWTHILDPDGTYDETTAGEHPDAVRIYNKWELFQEIEYACHIGGELSGEREFIESYTWKDADGTQHTEDKYINLYTGGYQMQGIYLETDGQEETVESITNQGFPDAAEQAERGKLYQLRSFIEGRGMVTFLSDIITSNVYELEGAVAPVLTKNDYFLWDSFHTKMNPDGDRPLWASPDNAAKLQVLADTANELEFPHVVAVDYMDSVGTATGLTENEKNELLTFILADSVAIGIDYIDVNGIHVTPNFTSFLEAFRTTEEDKVHIIREPLDEFNYLMTAPNGHTLETRRSPNVLEYSEVVRDTLNNVNVLIDGVQVTNVERKVYRSANLQFSGKAITGTTLIVTTFVSYAEALQGLGEYIGYLKKNDTYLNIETGNVYICETDGSQDNAVWRLGFSFSAGTSGGATQAVVDNGVLELGSEDIPADETV